MINQLKMKKNKKKKITVKNNEKQSLLIDIINEKEVILVKVMSILNCKGLCARRMIDL